jgi:Mn-containing catalase
MLKELLVEEMRDILHAENQLVKALPKMIRAAHTPPLKSALENHLRETQGQVERLQEAFELLGEKAKGKPCKGMQGLIEEGQEVIKDGKEQEEAIADLALIGAGQRVEHYEISAYGTARTMAEQLGLSKVAKLLSQSLSEEEKADQTLTKIALPLLKTANQLNQEEMATR